MKKIFIFSCILFMFVTRCYAVDPALKADYKTKIGSNVLSWILIGDVNGLIERQFSENFSVVSTIHYVTSGLLQDLETDFRASVGIRTYSLGDVFNFGLKVPDPVSVLQPKLTGNFIEVKIGLWRLVGDIESSIEIGAGYSQMFNEKVFYEWKLGLGRLYDDESTVIPIASAGLGIII